MRIVVDTYTYTTILSYIFYTFLFNGQDFLNLQNLILYF